MRATRVCIAAILALALTPSTAAAADPGKRSVVVLEDGAASAAAVAADLEDRYGVDAADTYGAIDAYAATVTPGQARELSLDPRVEYVVPDRAFAAAPPPQPQALSCEDAATLEDQCLDTGVDRIDADSSSARSGDGTGTVGVNIAIVDTGVDIDHPDLNVAGGVECSGSSPPLTSPPGDDLYGHGTFVAGLAAATDDEIGVVGVAPGAPLWAVSVIDANGAFLLGNLLCGVDWVTRTRTDGDPTNDIAVANLSLGGAGSDDGACGTTNRDPLHTALCRSVAAGVTWVVAAGNDTTDLRRASPASYDEVLTATAAGDFDGQPGDLAEPDCYGDDYGDLGLFDDRTAAFSNFALSADAGHTIAAPGVCLQSTVPATDDGAWGIGNGTSFSSPLTAGTAALCIASGPCSGLTPPQITSRLVADARAYSEGNPGYGFQGDPLRQLGGRYIGHLIRAGAY